MLDVGCGKGELASRVAERCGATVIAIDASPWMLEFARARFAHPGVTYVQADAVALHAGADRRRRDPLERPRAHRVTSGALARVAGAERARGGC